MSRPVVLLTIGGISGIPSVQKELKTLEKKNVMASKTKPNLYALLIGIGDYQPPVSKLAGTIGDLRDMESYLKEVESTHFSISIRTLEEDQATKANIIIACQEHFTKAGPEDSVLLFFAGHGTREHAHSSVWTTETNNLLECLVCYDGVTIDEYGDVNTNLLADKELRDLQAEVRNNLRGRFDQQPEAYPSTHPEDLYATFLGKAVEPRPNYGIVQFNQPEDGEGRWVINLGSLSGLVLVGTKVLVDTPDGQLTAEVSRVHLAFSELSFAPATAPDPENTYRGVPNTQHLPALPLLVSFAADAPVSATTALTRLLSEKSTLEVTDQAAAAKYELSTDGEKSWLTLPGDHRLLIHPVRHDDVNFTLTWNRYLDHLVEWHRLLDLENPAPFRFKKFPLQVILGIFDENGQETELPDREYQPGLFTGPTERNRSDRPLFSGK